MTVSWVQLASGLTHRESLQRRVKRNPVFLHLLPPAPEGTDGGCGKQVVELLSAELLASFKLTVLMCGARSQPPDLSYYDDAWYTQESNWA